MYWTSPRTPCSGPKSAASVTPGAASRRSARCRNRASTLVGLTIAPTRSPCSARNCSPSHTSSPFLTRMSPSVPRHVASPQARSPAPRATPAEPPEPGGGSWSGAAAPRVQAHARSRARRPGSAAGGVEGAHRLLLRLERLHQRGGLLLPPRAAVEVGQRTGDHRVLRLRLVEVGQRLLRQRHLPRLFLDARELELQSGVPVARADEPAELLLCLGPVTGPLRERREPPVCIDVV